LIGVEMIHDDTRAVRHTLCLVCIKGNTFFSGAIHQEAASERMR
jgi:hypothetical protein